MAIAKARGTGETVRWTATGAKVRGDVIILDASTNFIGIVIADSVASGEETDLAVTGEYEFTKESATDAFVAGYRLSVTGTGTVEDSTSGHHRAAATTLNGDTTMRVLINVGGGSATVAF